MCPPINVAALVLTGCDVTTKSDECTTDDECSGTDKCCSDGCSLVCKPAEGKTVYILDYTTGGAWQQYVKFTCHMHLFTDTDCFPEWPLFLEYDVFSGFVMFLV